MKKIIQATICSLFLASLFMVSAVQAQTTGQTEPNRLLQTLKNVGGAGGYQTDPSKASVTIIIGTIISAFLGFLGIIFVILMIIAGFHWMRAQGNEEEIKKAKDTIREALIGLVVALSSYAIWNFIFTHIIK